VNRAVEVLEGARGLVGLGVEQERDPHNPQAEERDVVERQGALVRARLHFVPSRPSSRVVADREGPPETARAARCEGQPFPFQGETMIAEKWRARWRKPGRVLLYVAAVVYLLVLLYDIDSMQSDISSIQSDVSSMQSDLSNIEDGTCTNNRLCP